MWEAALQWDRDALIALNAWGGPGWDQFWLALSGKWTALPLYALLLYWVFRALGWKRALLLLAGIALMITCTDQLSNVFKTGVGRLRPCHDPGLDGLIRLVKASCGGRYGYFSAHAANAMALAVFFGSYWGRAKRSWGFLLLLWALLVGYSRVYLGVHYPLDVLSGMLAGAFFGWLFARLTALALQKWMP